MYVQGLGQPKTPDIPANIVGELLPTKRQWVVEGDFGERDEPRPVHDSIGTAVRSVLCDPNPAICANPVEGLQVPEGIVLVLVGAGVDEYSEESTGAKAGVPPVEGEVVSH